MEYVYVLRTEEWEKHYYIGVTSNVEKRLKQHNEGKNRSTKNADWRIVYLEGYIKRKAAEEREKKLKRDRRVWRHVKERIEKSLE